MNNINLRLCWYFFVFILVASTIFYWTNINSNSWMESIDNQKIDNQESGNSIIVATQNTEEKKDNIENIELINTLTPEEEKTLKVKTSFNTSCTQITSNEKIKELLNDWIIILDNNIKTKIISYIDNEIVLTELENILLEKIWEIDWTESWEQRLYLNYMFLILNDIKRWNNTDCTDIFTQYYK